MKNTDRLLFLFFLVFSGNSFSQNWKLLDEDKTYFYKHVDSLYITNTIKIDSTVNSAADSVFYIHTTIKVCDTCSTVPSNAAGGLLYHIHYPEIFGNTPTCQVAMNHFQMADGIIQHQAGLSDSWIFNASLSINATVTDKYETLILGDLDSVKVIELSTSDTIVISKNHGVIRYPDFENSGKYFTLTGYHQGQNSYGEYLPNMWRIYDFNIGDVFCFSHYHSWIDTDQCSQGDIFKIAITGDFSNAVEASYSAYIIYKHYESCVWGGYYDYYIDNMNTSLGILNDDAYYENTFSGALDSYTDLAPELPATFYDIFFPSWEVDHEVYLEAGEMHFMHHRFENNEYIKYVLPMTSFTDSLYFINSDYGYHELMEFREGFGRTFWEIYQFENIRNDELNAWVKDGDTTGVLYQFTVLDEFNNSSLQIYPNPAANLIQIPENLQLISVYSLTGTLIHSVQNPGESIFTGDLPRGMYVLKAVDEDGNQLLTKLILE